MPNLEQKDALGLVLLEWADDELILGHRNSEWCGHAPILEEDIAFANIALDELGHAMLWYGAYAKNHNGDPDIIPDRLVYQREPAEFRSSHFVELANQDWAFTIVRQYLFDMHEAVRLIKLKSSPNEFVAEIATKILPEEYYHRRHAEAWVKRLGLGTEESNHRMQTALDQLWHFAVQLFSETPARRALAEGGVTPAETKLHEIWEAAVVPFLKSAGLTIPGKKTDLDVSRTSHTAGFEALIEDLQSVARSDPGAIW